MTFYHGTSKENWDAIQKEGILLGKEIFESREIRRTYLTPDKEEAKCYGKVVLKVEYNPLIHPEQNNYCEGCWQVRVYEPIPLSQIKRM